MSKAPSSATRMARRCHPACQLQSIGLGYLGCSIGRILRSDLSSAEKSRVTDEWRPLWVREGPAAFLPPLSIKSSSLIMQIMKQAREGECLGQGQGLKPLFGVPYPYSESCLLHKGQRFPQLRSWLLSRILLWDLPAPQLSLSP